MKKPIWLILVLAIIILLAPSIIYLCFLIPKMKEDYIVLMSSSGVIGSGGMYGASIIPEKTKYSSLFKTATRAFTLLVVITLIQDFLPQIIGLIAVLITSYIIFKILLEVYKSAKRRKENGELANQIARSIVENTK